ncbi:hypothetical protein IPZ61_15705 [Streptomyces sioyaensis]|uniref:hypothetical protein n=1 Tax=Streptomyces sioyaensis TaxID=67364 RepID=UPI001F3D8D29|nr:hypothetical protein [Streptomyces sioyaensis]MCF3174763.1 hypothetical protein [Streptomyces sioyaensis]
MFIKYLRIQLLRLSYEHKVNRVEIGGCVMVAVVVLGSVPTVHLFVRVPVPMASGGWSWGELSGFTGSLAREFAYSALECASLVSTYGRTMTRVLTRRELGDRFTICARGPVTGMLLGLREWEWSPDARDYRAVGEYMCGWREAVRAYYIKTGEFAERQRFTASAGTLATRPDSLRLAQAA